MSFANDCIERLDKINIMDNNPGQKTPNNKVWLEDEIVYYVMSCEVDECEAVLLNSIGLEYINKRESLFYFD